MKISSRIFQYVHTPLLLFIYHLSNTLNYDSTNISRLKLYILFKVNTGVDD